MDSKDLNTLISTAELQRHLSDTHWVIADCRHDLMKPDAGHTEYAMSHIPGARFMHLDRDLAGPQSGKNGRHPLPDAAVLAAKLGAAGIGPETCVVAYDAQDGINASRLWWMLRWLGHSSVAVLDGGWLKWVRENRPRDDAIPTPRPTRFAPRTVRSGDPGSCVDAAYVLSHLERQEMLLVDARSPERFRGETEPIDPVAGRIPGSVNRFYKQNLDAAGCFRPHATLRADFMALLNAHRPEHVVHSCGSGVSACHNLLAMEIAGLAGSRLYPGSWSEWCADPARPVERGARG
ncbi:MAG: 3-mercaptopyruvate sulfurtransferase [Betaproteobacteria bacterium RIFCSPLOWO2_12_FULL_63_13]|nr:MAG: 3-mercaptopyruvate sulfurtransferase [Betaproteobacteria bacterium RIFCSPLOWO2_02_FULL_63_19]OGA42650.1 MAG: 3-mercaptopyruvate sulfurtransferase [Betaproteobacteria bacterium RIFCSPLOWO2_12_FULL_63_13]